MAVAIFNNKKTIQIEAAHKCGRTTVRNTLKRITNTAVKQRVKFPQGIFLGDRHQNKFLNNNVIDFKLAIVRDPIDRIKSCYKDRVLNRNKVKKVILWKDFIKNLEYYRDNFDDIYEHSNPQYVTIGKDIKYYNDIINTYQINEYLPSLLYKLSGSTIQIQQKKISDNNVKLSLDQEDIDIIKDFYSLDYDLFSKYF